MTTDQSILVLVAEAVAAELRSITFTLKASINRNRYVTTIELSDIGSLRVDVVPGDVDEVGKAGRAGTVRTCRIDVVIRKRFNESTEVDAATGEIHAEEIDRLILLAEQIQAFFDGRRLELYPQATWMDNPETFRPIYDPNHLRTLRQFTGVVGIKYRVVV